MTKQRAKQIFEYLKTLFPNANCELNFKNPYELLVAVVLSAQCTDKRVNIITPSLFLKYPTVQALAKADLPELEQIIKSCGLYKTKAKNLISAANSIVKDFSLQIPQDVEDLQKLAGVGRKSANVITSVAFGNPAIAVDTHVLRVSNRLGLSSSNNPLVVEQDLMKLFEKKDWIELHYMLVLFGRYYCTARGPKCKECNLREKCPYYNSKQQEKKKNKK